MPYWLMILGWVAFGLTSFAVIYRLAIRPVTKGIAEIVETLPIIREIVEQVRNDGGSSLKDTTNRIDARADANEKLVKEVAARLESHTESVADRLATVTEASEARHAAQSAYIEDYLSKFKHGNEGLMESLIAALTRDPDKRTRGTDESATT